MKIFKVFDTYYCIWPGVQGMDQACFRIESTENRGPVLFGAGGHRSYVKMSASDLSLVE